MKCPKKLLYCIGNNYMYCILLLYNADDNVSLMSIKCKRHPHTAAAAPVSIHIWSFDLINECVCSSNMCVVGNVFKIGVSFFQIALTVCPYVSFVRPIWQLVG